MLFVFKKIKLNQMIHFENTSIKNKNKNKQGFFFRLEYFSNVFVMLVNKPFNINM